jgi:hypothetical protein
MTDHTPTPWEINPARTVENTFMITGGQGFDFGMIADVTEEADAAFIVKAANAYDRMFEALREIMRTANEPGDRRALVDRIYSIAAEACRSTT